MPIDLNDLRRKPRTRAQEQADWERLQAGLQELWASRWLSARRAAVNALPRFAVFRERDAELRRLVVQASRPGKGRKP